MRLPYGVYLDAIEEDVERILAASARATLTSPVRTCPGWNLEALLVHLSGVYWRFIAQLRAGEPNARADAAPLPDLDPGELLEHSGDELIAELRRHAPEDPCWNFTGTELVAGFVARRQAHESAIHRVDAELVRSKHSSIERELAVDGIDERLTIMLPYHLGRSQGSESTGGSLCLVCSDDPAAWVVEVDRGRVRLRDGRGPADTAVVGSASDLFCVSWNRPVSRPLEVTGPDEPLSRWRQLPG